jgi:hypothetical protein
MVAQGGFKGNSRRSSRRLAFGGERAPERIELAWGQHLQQGAFLWSTPSPIVKGLL